MKESEESASFIKQAFACCTIYTLSMSIGAASGYSGVAIPQLESEEGGFGLTKDQSSWLASLGAFATIPTCMLGGFLGEYLGRRTVCQLVSPLFLTGFICVALAPDIHLLFFGRVLGGLALGLVSAPAGVYVSEVSTPAWRSTFGGGLSAFYMVGMVIVFILGKWVDWRTLAGCSCVFPLLSLLLLTMIPESPSWLVTQGRLTEARRALVWLRGEMWDVENELNRLKAEFSLTQKKEEVEKANDGGCTQNWRKWLDLLVQLQRPDVLKPLLIMSVLMMLQQFCGVATLTYYTVSIMEQSGSSLDKYTATIIYGFIRLVATFSGALLLRRFARRPLFIGSALFVSLGMSLLGAAVYLTKEDVEMAGIVGLLPLISVNIVAVSYQLGLGPIGWSYMAELFPVDLRSVLSGVISCLVNIYIFLVIKTFPSVQSSLTPWGGYWFYSGVALLAAIFGVTTLPETKGKSLAEVSEYFYTCCTMSKLRKEDVESDAILETVHNESFVYHKPTDSAMEEEKVKLREKEEQLEVVELKVKRRSLELGVLERSVRRKTVELSQLEVEVERRDQELKEKEELLWRRSAPLVQLEELEDLLLQAQ